MKERVYTNYISVKLKGKGDIMGWTFSSTKFVFFKGFFDLFKARVNHPLLVISDQNPPPTLPPKNTQNDSSLTTV